MNLPPLIQGHFIRRENRFRATVNVDGCEAAAHVPNSGRLLDLFSPGRQVWLAPAAAPHRKTAYDLRLVDLEGTLVSVDARLPAPLLAEALEAGEIPELRPLTLQREVSFGGSRLDLRLRMPEGPHWVEAKSVTLVCSGTALFPDAPTARGRRHLAELVRAVRGGEHGSVFFVVQRPDARRFAPHPEADPPFADALRSARHAGVAVRAFTCRVSLREVRLGPEIPVDLGGHPR